MEKRILAGLYGLSDPRLASMVVVILTVVLAALASALFPAHFGGLLAPASGGTANG